MEYIMKKIIVLMVMACTALIFSTSAISSVQSLRCGSELDASANKVMKHKIEVVQGGIKRNFKKQPPLVPHAVEKYKISLHNNGCLKCHSEKSFKK